MQPAWAPKDDEEGWSDVLECVVNVSEGRDGEVLRALDEVCGAALLDRHTDAHHHRSVFTLLGEQAPRDLAAAAVERLTLPGHDGVHPRIGVVDVVPFVALDGSTPADALRARDAFVTWVADDLGVPAFRYGDDVRTLPDVRRQAWHELLPDAGPPAPHPTAGAAAVGARPVLVAYNLWLAEPNLGRAKAVAATVRTPRLRTLGLAVGERVQVSCHLVDPLAVGPAEAWDRVAEHAEVAGAELVGLVPEAVLARTDPERWAQLDLAADRTIEARVATSGWAET
jgi:glutamate formiminotransferase